MKERTAEELANGYLKECRTITLMRYGTLAIFLFLLLCLWNKLNVVLCVVLVAVFYLALRFLRTMKGQQFSLLQQVLREDCDAVKYTAVMEHVLARSKEDTHYLNLCRIQGLCASGRFQEASDALAQVYIQRADLGIRLLYLQVSFDCRLALGDPEAARQLRQEAAQLKAQSKPQQHPAVEKALRVMDAALALSESLWEDFYAQEEQVQAEAANQFQLVASAFRMGKADLSTGDREGAREHLEDVAAEGGTLWMASEARRLLENLAPAQLSEAPEA